MNIEENETETRVQDLKVKQGKKRKYLFGGLLVVVALSLIAYLGYTLLNNSKRTTEQGTIEKLTVATYTSEFDLDYPKAETALAGSEVSVASQVYEGLVRYENLGTPKPLLATSWTNPQGDTNRWDFNLKRGVKFHTGRIMTAEDVKYSIEAMQASKTASANVYTNTIKSVDVLSPYKVRITTTQPDSLLINKLPNIYIIDSKSKATGAETAKRGTGPFTIDPKGVQNKFRLDFVAFSQYHGKKSKVKKLTIKSYDSYEAMLKALQKKQVDLAGDVLDEDLPKFKSDSYKIIYDNAPLSIYIAYRVNKPNSPLAKKAVRQAIGAVIDKEAFFKTTGYSGSVIQQLVPSQLPGYNPNLKQETIDVARARSLLAQAGYPNGFSISFYHYDGFKPASIKVLSDSLAKINVKLIDNTFPDLTDSEIQNFIDKDIPDALVYGWSSSYNDGEDFFNTGLVQHTGIKEAAYQNLLNQASSEFYPEKRLKVLQQLSQYVADEQIVTPLYTRTYYQINASPNYVFTQDISGISQSFYYAKTYKNEE